MQQNGNRFIILCEDFSQDTKLLPMEKYDELVFAIGAAYEDNVKNVRLALHNADELMYADKKHYYELHPEKKRGIIR